MSIYLDCDARFFSTQWSPYGAHFLQGLISSIRNGLMVGRLGWDGGHIPNPTFPQTAGSIHKLCRVFKVVTTTMDLKPRSRIRETLNLSICAFSSTNTMKFRTNGEKRRRKRCQVSCGRCHVAGVTCPELHVTYYLSHVTRQQPKIQTLPLLTPPLYSLILINYQKILINYQRI